MSVEAEVIWGKNCLLKIHPQTPEVPIADAHFEMIMALRKQPLVRRLLWAFHFECCRAANLTIILPEKELAELVWRPRPPRHWRRQLKEALNRALKALVTWGLKTRPKFKYNLKTGTYTLIMPPEYLYALRWLATPKGRLLMYKTNPNPDARISSREIQQLQDAGYHSYLIDQLENKEADYPKYLRQEIIRQRKLEADTPTLSLIAKKRETLGRWRMIFIPALLGDKDVCGELGDVINLLINFRTRWKQGIQQAYIAASSGNNKILCPLLDPGVVYAAFAGNFGGRGFYLSQWATYLGTTDKKFLQRLEEAADRLGLTVVGVDRENRFYGLAELAADWRLWEKARIRIYSPANFRWRWATLCGWSPPLETPNDRMQLRQWADEAGGIRRTAWIAKVDAGNLAYWFKHGRRLSAPAVERVRKLLTRVHQHVHGA